MRTLPAFPEKEVKIEAVSGAVVLNGAADARRAWLAMRRIPGIKTLDNRLVSGELLTWD